MSFLVSLITLENEFICSSKARILSVNFVIYKYFIDHTFKPLSLQEHVSPNANLLGKK